MPASHTSGHVVPAALNIAQAGAPYSGAKTPPAATLVSDLYFGGLGRVAGTVAEKATPANVPLRRRVVLIDERTRHAIRETWSDTATGAYVFDSIASTRTYTVVSYDHTSLYGAVVADALVPEPMP